MMNAAGRLGPANQASLAVSPSVRAKAALISHRGRCQFVFCLEHRKLNNPSECGFPFFLCIYSQKSLLAHPHCGRAGETRLFPEAPAVSERDTKALG